MINLTKDDIDEDYDADVYSMIITKVFDSEKERDDFKQQILDDYEKARKWDNLVEHGLTNKEVEQELTTIEHIREYLSVMKDEPDEYILLSKVYHNLRRILGDEE